MAVIQASTSGAITATSTNNRTGRFKGAATSTISSGLMKGTIAGRESIITGNLVKDNTWADKALSSGTFAYLVAGKYIIRRVSLTISGVATNVLKSGAGSKNKRSIHYVTTNRHLQVAEAIRAGYWDIFNGVFTTAPDAVNDSFGDDHAATPSRSVPGELTFKYGRPLPLDEEYAAKTNG